MIPGQTAVIEGVYLLYIQYRIMLQAKRSFFYKILSNFDAKALKIALLK
jgi:hypothetical protein